jgi:hypothetical protein
MSPQIQSDARWGGDLPDRWYEMCEAETFNRLGPK